MSRLFIRPSATGWEPIILKGLSDKKVTIALEAVVLSVSTLLKVVAASITQIKISPLMQLLILYPLIL